MLNHSTVKLELQRHGVHIISLSNSIFWVTVFFNKHSLCPKAICLHGTLTFLREHLNGLGYELLLCLFSLVIHVVWDFNPSLLWWFTVNACPSLSVSLRLPHRSTLPKSGYRKYGPPSVQLAHDLTLWQLDFNSLHCVCVHVFICLFMCHLESWALSLMCIFTTFLVLLIEEKAGRTFVSISPRVHQTHI